MSNLEPTELVLRVAERRRQARHGTARVNARAAATPTGSTLVRRACVALFMTNALLYIATFGALAALPWAAVAMIVHRAPT
jgi:hypothetical protein